MFMSSGMLQHAQSALNSNIFAPFNGRQEKQEQLKETFAVQPYEGSHNTGGITWPGSQFSGPGNKLIDPITHESNFTELPKTNVDWATLEHDTDYYNITNPTIENVWELDKKAIKNSFGQPDLYYGGEAVAVGLALKHYYDQSLGRVFRGNNALYPPANTGEYHIPWFDKRSQISRRVLKGTYGSGTRSSATSTSELGEFK